MDAAPEKLRQTQGGLRETRPRASHEAPFAPAQRGLLLRQLAAAAAVGAVLVVLAPFGTDRVNLPLRAAYWMSIMVGGAALGAVVRYAMVRLGWIGGQRVWRDGLVTSVAMAAVMTLVVGMANAAVFGLAFEK